ncbi:hypothetical protein KIN20_009827 [Parelaphostrongylus tenuis]|uniref:Uncharacterized protein n=1 Tax=Parelaphostrongylus tenuis TaxID=148309 RepID=A0AAD5QIF8_PARTN|nr:hypothetical protein KIN20_009827 [Parelaphostrongylus tenuis]
MAQLKSQTAPNAETWIGGPELIFSDIHKNEDLRILSLICEKRDTPTSRLRIRQNAKSKKDSDALNPSGPLLAFTELK